MEQDEVSDEYIEQARPFRADDLEAVVSLRLHAIDTEPQAFTPGAAKQKEWSMQKWRNYYVSTEGEPPARLLEIVMSGKSAVGMLGAIPGEGPNTWKLVGMYVRQGFRRKGIADSLFREIETRVRRTGGTTLTLHVNDSQTGAIKFYEKHGMVRTVTDRREREDGTEYHRHTYEKPLV